MLHILHLQQHQKYNFRKFGTKQQMEHLKPFHLYSMKQAIEEGFILDVLSNYTTYRVIMK